MTQTQYTDIGANLLNKQFDVDREEVINRAHAAGVSRMLITCTDLPESARGIEFCRSRGGGFWCTAGVHPHDAKNVGPDWHTHLASLAENPEVKAIGETGLDFNRNFSPPQRQIEVFDTQLGIAAEIGKPVFVHDRDSRSKVFELLSAHASRLSGVVVHCFTGSREDLARYIDAGFYIGITGWICDERRGQAVAELAAEIPLDRLLVETDAPYLRPRNARVNASLPSNKSRNEPALLHFVIEKLAHLYQRDPAEIARATQRNASALFDLPQCS